MEIFNQDSKFEISEDSASDNKLDGVISEDSDKEFVEFKLKENEQDKQLKKNNFYCKICETQFITIKDLINHRKKNIGCAFKCQICNETFVTNKKLHKHRLESENCKVTSNKCNICDRIFGTKTLLKRHQGAHTDEAPYACKLCDKKFKFPQNLRRHDNIAHKGVKPFKCDICGKGKLLF